MSEWTPDIARLVAFDDAEWLAVERAFCGRLLAYVARRIPDRDAREDVVQEVFLGAVRGIQLYDPAYTFEQFLFGICRNRVIDHQRRQKPTALGGGRDEDDARPSVEDLVSDDETPSRIARRNDLEREGSRVLRELVRQWVQETWSQGEFQRLIVVEALFAAGWRNRDVWTRLGLRDESTVAGIKFRALKRLREIALERGSERELLAQVGTALDEEQGLDLDLKTAWVEGRASCPARHWLARQLAGTLPEGPASFVRFHLEDVRCPWCRANLDDLERMEDERGLAPLLERMGQSTIQLLRSRSLGGPGAVR
ncbi:MAG: sigma-70 family RNA polymerase sigma factor [Planctomycetota bacterium]|nr:sigma-70 family RNA polymerase sigma factor [Planctomycetota bacterium]